MAEQNDAQGVSEGELAEALALVRSRRRRSSETTILVRGEGGAVFEMAPSRMSKDMKRRLQMGRLRQVNADGTPLSRPPREDASARDGDAGGSALTQGRIPRPARSAPKKDWVTYAVAALGVDSDEAEGMSRGDLIELPDDYAQHGSPAPEAPPETGEDGGTEPVADSPAREGAPAKSAPKKAWIDYTVSRGLVSREDAANFTRDDLIEMTA